MNKNLKSFNQHYDGLAFFLLREKNKNVPLFLSENQIGRNQNLPVVINDISIAQHHATITIE